MSDLTPEQMASLDRGIAQAAAGQTTTLELFSDEDLSKMKMYIFVKSTVPVHFVPVMAAHSAVACYAKYRGSVAMDDWFDHSFKKVVCKVTPDEFELLKHIQHGIVLTESALGDEEVVIAFPPSYVKSAMFRSFPLWHPSSKAKPNNSWRIQQMGPHEFQVELFQPNLNGPGEDGWESVTSVPHDTYQAALEWANEKYAR